MNQYILEIVLRANARELVGPAREGVQAIESLGTAAESTQQGMTSTGAAAGTLGTRLATMGTGAATAATGMTTAATASTRMSTAGAAAATAASRLGTAAAGAGRAVGDMASGMSLANSQITSLAARGGAVATVIAAIGSASFNAAAQVETGFAQIEGLVGITGDALEELRSGAQGVGDDIGISMSQAADGLFTLTSAGLRGQDAIEGLETAGRLAAIGLGTTETAGRAVTAVMNAYADSNITAAAAGDFFAATARAGSFSVEELIGSIGRVLPIASTAGVSLGDLGGAIALLTQNGLKAPEAITQINALLRALVAPSEQAKAALESVGLSFEDVQRTLQTDGLVAAIQLLGDAADGSNEAMVRMVGSAEAAGAAFTILNADAAQIEATVGAVGNSMGVLEEAYDAVADTAAKRMADARAAIDDAFASLGQDLLPAVATIAEGVAAMANAFAALPPEVFDAVVQLDDFFDLISSIGEVASALRLDDLARSIAGIGEAAAGLPIVGDVFGLIGDAALDAINPLGALADGLSGLAGSNKEVATATTQAFAAFERQAETVNGATDALIEQAAAAGLVAQENALAAGGLTEVQAAAVGARTAMAALEQLTARARVESGEFADRWVDVATAMATSANGVTDYVAALRILTDEVANAQRGAIEMQEAFTSTRTRFGDYFADLINGANEAAAAVDDLKAQFDNVDLELGVEIDEGNLTDAIERILDITEEDYTVAIDADTRAFDDATAAALLKINGFTDEQIVATLSADDTQFDVVMGVVGAQLGLYSGSVHEAALTLDASQAEQVFKIIADALAQLSGINLSVDMTAPINELHGFDAAGRNAIQTINALKFNFGDAQNAASGAADALDRVGGSGSRAGGGGRAAADGIDEAARAAEEAAEAAEEFAEAVDDVLDTVSEIAAANEDLAESFDAVGDAVDDAQDKIDAFNGIDKDRLEIDADFFDALDDLTEGFGDEEFVATLDVELEIGRENIDNFRSVIEAAQEQLTSDLALGVNADVAIANYDATIGQLRQLAIDAGFSEEAVDTLFSTLAEVPPEVVIGAEVDIDAAAGNLRELEDDMRNFDGTTVEAVVAVEAQRAREEMAQTVLEAEQLTGYEALVQIAADANPFDEVATATLLTIAGFEDAEAIARLGADDADLQAALIAALIDIGLIDNRQARVVLRAQDEATATMGDVRARLEEIENLDVEAILAVDSTGIETGVAEALIIAEQFTVAEFQAQLTADGSQLDDEVNKAILTMAGFTDRKATALIDGDPTRLNDALLAASIALGLIDGEEAIATITADDSDFDGKAQRVERFAEQLGAPITATINVEGEGTEQIAETSDDINELDGAEANVNVNADGDIEVINEAATEIEILDGASANVSLNVEGTGGEVIDETEQDLDEIDGKDAQAEVTVSRRDRNVLRRVVRNLDEIDERVVEPEISADADPAIDAIGDVADALDDIESQPVELSIEVDAEQAAVDIETFTTAVENAAVAVSDELVEGLDQLSEELGDVDAAITPEMVERLAELTEEAGELDETVSADFVERVGAFTDEVLELAEAITPELAESMGTLSTETDLFSDAVTAEFVERLALLVEELIRLDETADAELAENVRLLAEAMLLLSESLPEPDALTQIAEALQLLSEGLEDGTAEELQGLAEALALLSENTPDPEALTSVADALTSLSEGLGEGTAEQVQGVAEALGDLATAAAEMPEDGISVDIDAEPALTAVEEISTALTELGTSEAAEIEITANGEQALATLTEITVAAEALATLNPQIEIATNAATVAAEIGGLATAVDTATAPRTLTITSNVAAVNAEAGALAVAMTTATQARTITVSSNLAAVTTEANGLDTAATTATAPRTLTISTNAAAATGEVNAFSAAADAAVKPRTATIDVVVNGAAAAAAAIDAAAASRTATINVAVNVSQNVTRTITERTVGSATGSALGAARQAAGFANGGLNFPGGIEDHTPKIYTGSHGLRIFNEPETEGEGFVPLGIGKRHFAVPIMREISDRFGYDFIPRFRQFNNGGITAATFPSQIPGLAVGSAAATPVILNLGGVQIDAPGMSPQQVAALARKEQAGFERRLASKIQRGSRT